MLYKFTTMTEQPQQQPQQPEPEPEMTDEVCDKCGHESVLWCMSDGCPPENTDEEEEEICPSCGDEWTEATRCDCPERWLKEEEEDLAWFAHTSAIRQVNKEIKHRAHKEETGFGTAYHDGSGFEDCDPENTGYRLCSQYPKEKWCSECVYLGTPIIP